MNRKPVTLMFVLLLALVMVFSGCNRSASPPLPDEDAMLLEAEGNTTPVPPEEPMEVVTDPPSVEPTVVPVDPTEVPPEEPTPVPTETPSEPVETEVPTLEPTVEPIEPGGTVAGPGKHIVQPNENLYRIALRYGTTVGVLANANGIANPARIYVGQELTIPAGGSPGTTPPPSSPPTGGTGVIVHTVQLGENLFRIALRYNYDQHYIARYNGISNPALIYPGQDIRIPQP